MKLKNIHIIPYLPYGLKGKFFEVIDIVKEYDFEYNLIEGLNSGAILLKNFKPILRPLSDLAKEIEINGKKFVPAKIIWNCSTEEEENFDVYGEIPEFWQIAIKVIPLETEYRTMERLFKWHFDCFELIKSGLAINKNNIDYKN